jgi:hypothetical protein
MPMKSESFVKNNFDLKGGIYAGRDVITRKVTGE